MWSTAREVAAGDTVIIWLTRDLILPLVINPKKDFNTKFGNFKQSAFIGVPYGSKVPSPSGKGFLYILRPTPELWTLALPHRTQILYAADIAFVLAWLGVRRGSGVVEAGTGSGSFSHSVVRTVGSGGRLWSYEFHEARYRKAKEEFTQHGMDDVVMLHHRNVSKDGFMVVGEADAVFLDLPAPWDAVEHAKKALRKDRPTRICTFSPCIEQVLRTITALNDAGFTDISTYETLLRPIEVFQQVPVLAPISGVSEKIKASERRREEKRVRQVAANAAARGREGKEKESIAAGKKRKRDEDEVTNEGENGVGEDGDGEEEDGEGGEGSKRAKPDFAEEGMQIDDEGLSGSTYLPIPEAAEVPASSSSTSAPLVSSSASSSISTSTSIPHPQPTKINLSKALPEVRGHTSYLTFAVLVPVPPFVSCSGKGAASREGGGVNGVATVMEMEASGSGSRSGDGDGLVELADGAGDGDGGGDGGEAKG